MGRLFSTLGINEPWVLAGLSGHLGNYEMALDCIVAKPCDCLDWPLCTETRHATVRYCSVRGRKKRVPQQSVGCSDACALSRGQTSCAALLRVQPCINDDRKVLNRNAEKSRLLRVPPARF